MIRTCAPALACIAMTLGAAAHGAQEGGAPVAASPSEPGQEARGEPVPPSKVDRVDPTGRADAASASSYWPRLARMGVRGGYLILSSGPGLDYGNAPLFGFYIGLSRPGSRVTCEIGVDASYLHENRGQLDSVFLGERLDYLFDLRARNPRGQPYLLAGAEAFQELVLDEVGEPEAGNYAGALNLGAGIALRGGRFDARVTQSVLFGSGNVSGLTLLSASWRF